MFKTQATGRVAPKVTGPVVETVASTSFPEAPGLLGCVSLSVCQSVSRPVSPTPPPICLSRTVPVRHISKSPISTSSTERQFSIETTFMKNLKIGIREEFKNRNRSTATLFSFGFRVKSENLSANNFYRSVKCHSANMPRCLTISFSFRSSQGSLAVASISLTWSSVKSTWRCRTVGFGTSSSSRSDSGWTKSDRSRVALTAVSACFSRRDFGGTIPDSLPDHPIVLLVVSAIRLETPKLSFLPTESRVFSVRVFRLPVFRPRFGQTVSNWKIASGYSQGRHDEASQTTQIQNFE